MAGTQPTDLYNVIASTGLGRVGLREFAPGRFRIRVEPTFEGMMELETPFTRKEGWHHPGDNAARDNRFSKSVDAPIGNRKALLDLVEFTLWTLVADGRPFEVNPDGASWATKLISHDAMVSEVRARKVRGSNFASRWSTASLAKHLLK
jgi:hypothetical protein